MPAGLPGPCTLGFAVAYHVPGLKQEPQQELNRPRRIPLADIVIE